MSMEKNFPHVNTATKAIAESHGQFYAETLAFCISLAQ